MHGVRRERGWSNTPTFFATLRKEFHVSQSLQIKPKSLVYGKPVVGKNDPITVRIVFGAMELFNGGAELPPGAFSPRGQPK